MAEIKIIENGVWRVVYNENTIILFTNKGQTHTALSVFTGTYEECNQFIIDNNLIVNNE